MIQISYLSAATAPMSTSDLLQLLRQCRDNNASRGVTGMLLYANGTFLQVLEGPDQVIDDLVELIKKDKRHKNIRMLYRRAIEHREYSDWSMGFKKLSDKDLKGVDGLREFAEKDFNPEYLTQHVSVVQSLLDHYRKERATAIGHSELGIGHTERFRIARPKSIIAARLVGWPRCHTI